MDKASTSSPETGVAQVGGEVEVGFDSKFEDKWWIFEKSMWAVYVLFLLASISGILGRGLISKKTVANADKTFTVKYERIAHFHTPAEMTIHIAPGAVRNREAKLWVGGALLNQMLIRGIVPSPAQQVPAGAGLDLTFPAQFDGAAKIVIAFQPSSVGTFTSEVGVPDGPLLHLSTLVLP